MAYSEKVIEHYENPRNVGSFDKDDPSVGHRPRRRAGLRRRHEAADQGQRAADHRGRQVQDLRLRLGHRFVLAGDGVGQGHDGRQGDGAQELADRRGAQPAAGEDPLLGAGRGRDQGAPSPTTRRSGRQDGRKGGDQEHVGDSDSGAPRSRHGHRGQRQSGGRDQEAASQRATPPKGLRVGLRGGGCDGFSYVFEWADAEPGRQDQVLSFEDGTVRMFVDQKSMLYSTGTTLNFVTVHVGTVSSSRTRTSRGPAAAARASSSRGAGGALPLPPTHPDATRAEPRFC